jgi:hypothetical protein
MKYRVTVLEHINHNFVLDAACEEDAMQEARWRVVKGKAPLVGKEVVFVEVTEVEEVAEQRQPKGARP